MRVLIRKTFGLAFVIVLAAAAAPASALPIDDDLFEPRYLDKPLSHWRSALRNRNADFETALSAIVTLGPKAAAAIPELTAIVREPFIPIHIGLDSNEVIVAKLQDIQLRSDALEALAAIGEAAGSSSRVLINWALAERVIPDPGMSVPERGDYIEMVAVDVYQRILVAGVIATFGRSAYPELAKSIVSDSDEERKFAISIMADRVLPAAVALMQNTECANKNLGFEMIVHMWPVISKEHLVVLKRELACEQPKWPSQ